MIQGQLEVFFQKYYHVCLRVAFTMVKNNKEIKELYKNEATPDEFENIIKKYRYIAKHSPNGAKTINAVLENEYAIAEQLEKQKDRIEELETSQATVIDIQPHLEVNAAHARTDIDVTDEMIKHDDDIMDDDDF